MPGLSAEHEVALPYFGVALAVLFWGSFAVPMKFKAVSKVTLDPVVRRAAI